MKHSPHIMVIYDGVANSVFQGQVVAPLMSYRAQHPQIPVLLVSFETNIHSRRYEPLIRQLREHNITLMICRKYPLIHRLSLMLASRQLKTILSAYPHYSLIARGPLAGYICLQAYTPSKCTAFTIQARGLLAAEYDYMTRNNIGIRRWYDRYKIRLFTKIETIVYGYHTNSVTIETVSTALTQYLIATFGTPAALIYTTHHDIPPAIDAQQKKLWRTHIRQALLIAPDAHVYCYNGSAKAWQCPQQTIDYFYHQWQSNKKSFLLILTQDCAHFRQLIQQYNIPITHYAILQVPHDQVYQYLAACDTGIIFREPHSINWISRPTKILEYQAVGLTIIHNNTIALLADAEREPHAQPVYLQHLPNQKHR